MPHPPRLSSDPPITKPLLPSENARTYAHMRTQTRTRAHTSHVSHLIFNYPAYRTVPIRSPSCLTPKQPSEAILARVFSHTTSNASKYALVFDRLPRSGDKDMHRVLEVLMNRRTSAVILCTYTFIYLGSAPREKTLPRWSGARWSAPLSPPNFNVVVVVGGCRPRAMKTLIPVMAGMSPLPNIEVGEWRGACRATLGSSPAERFFLSGRNRILRCARQAAH